MNFSNKRARHLPQVPIIPMIDTMFFLLVFFILTSLNVIKLQGIPVNLPESRPAQPQKQQKKISLTINIKGDHSIYVNDVPTQGGNIGPTLLKVYARETQKAHIPQNIQSQAVVINAAAIVPHRMVVQAIDQARGVNVLKFSIATTLDDKPGQEPAALN